MSNLHHNFSALSCDFASLTWIFVCSQKVLNDALMGILRVRNLISPPYISTSPSVNVHRISKSDRFVVLGSDGLFDFFTNEEIVRLVHLFISRYPSGDPAKFLLEQLVIRAADCAGMLRFSSLEWIY